METKEAEMRCKCGGTMYMFQQSGEFHWECMKCQAQIPVIPQGVKSCPVCKQTMHEDCDERGDDYYKCSVCSHKQRIFHQITRRVSRHSSEPEDYPSGHA